MVSAEETASIPEGFMTFTVGAGSTASPKLTTFCLPLSRREAPGFLGRTAGVLSAVTASSLSDATAGWVPGSLSQAASPYFLRITSGAAEGLVFQVATASANTATSVSLLVQGLDLTSLGIIAGTDTYEIFPGETLLSLFGNGSDVGEGGVKGSNSAAGADVVRLNVGSSWIEYYFDTAFGFWRQPGPPANRNHVVLHPHLGISYFRKGASNLEVTIQGRVAVGPVKTIVSNGGATYVANHFPIDRTLGSLGIESIPGFIAAEPPAVPVASADTVSVWNGSGWKNYHYNAGLSQWREGSLPVNRSNAMIPSGVPFWIQKKTLSSGSSLLTEQLPYSP
jgi:hypothetical protein